MKTKFALCALSLGLFAVGCDDKPHNYSALQPVPTPVAKVIPLDDDLPRVPVVPAGPIRGGRGGTPKPPVTDDHPRDTDTPRSPDRGSTPSSVTPTRPERPQPDVSTRDPRDAGGRLDDSSCTKFSALTRQWTVKVDDHWDTLNRGGNKWVKKRLEERAGPFFSDALCEGLRALREKNALVAKQIVQRIGDKKLEILLTDDDEAGDYDKHRYHILWVVGVGKPQIKMGRRVIEGLVASELPDYVDTLAPSDSQLTREKDEKSRADTLALQIKAAKATFFHYVMHMAGARYDKDKHKGESFLFHQKELDVIHACTAQVYPYFYIDAVGMDRNGKTERGPFYTNSNLACLTCASASVNSKGEIYATMKFFDQEPTPETKILCESIKNHDPELAVTADRQANLYEEMN